MCDIDKFTIIPDDNMVECGIKTNSFDEYVSNFENWTLEVEKKESVTGREMCELICVWLKATADIDVEPEKIWNISPRGELYYMFGLYNLALLWQGETLKSE